MRVGYLWKRHEGKAIYVVGTGPSLRLMDLRYLRDKVSIGLNQSWRFLQTTYSLTVHPELYQEFLAHTGGKPVSRWIVKKKAPMKHLSIDDPFIHVFNTFSELPRIREQLDDSLYLGHGVQQTAMHLAAGMGASAIILVGVDMTDLGGDHHAHDQHVRFHGLPPVDVYREYREFTAAARREIEAGYGIPVLSLSPLLGECDGNEDYARLLEERGLKPLPKPKDTSGYMREATDKPGK